MIRNYKTWVTARLEEGQLAVNIVGSAEYTSTGRSATAAVSVPSDKLAAVQAALQQLLNEYQPAVENAATRAAAEALVVAARNGEEL